MSHYLPPQVMAFFAPRPPLPFVAPIEKTKPAGYEGVAPYMAKLRGEAPAASEAAPTDAASDPVVDAPCAAAMLTPSERAALAAGAKEEENAARLAVALESYNPGDIAMTSAWTDAPGRTLFVGRLHYDLTEEELKTEFTHFGEITRVVLPRTRAGRSVGYAFVEFSSADSVKRALAEADGQSLMGRRIVVDTERARSESGWLPRRLGGGLGLTRAGPPALCRTSPGRVSEGRLPPAVAEAYARGGMPAVAALNAHGPAHTQHHAADRRSGSGPRGPGAGDRGGDRGGGFRGGDRGGDRRGGEWRGGGGGDRGRGDRDRSDRDRGYGGDRGGDRDRAGYRDGGRDRRF